MTEDDSKAGEPIPACIGIDWGTTSFRGYRLDTDGGVIEGRRAEAGILAIESGGFEAVFEELVGDWLDAWPQLPVVMSGMIGSRQGWVEAPYLECPADLGDLAQALVPVPLARGRTLHLAPGLACRDPSGVPDVMRGEEVEILGALAGLGRDDAVLCLPGTHSKWVRVSAGRVVGFSTHMTGEVFDLLRRHSILGRMIEHGSWDDQAFGDGIGRSGAGGGLLNHLFGVRAAGLFGELVPETAGAFLSGLVIGHELRAGLAGHGPQRVDLIGDPALVTLYAKALGLLGVQSGDVSAGAAARGLQRLAVSLEGRNIK